LAYTLYISIGNTEVNDDEHSLFMTLRIGNCYE